MTDLERINKILNDIWYLMDTARSNFGEEGYNALDEAAESVKKAWNICKRGQEAKLENAYHTPVQSSKKSIKSDSDWHARNDYQNKEIYREAFASLVKDSDAQDFDNSPYGTVHYPGFYRVLVDGTYETEFSAETDEEAIQKFKDYFAESRGINNSKKSIKSSLEDRLIPYLEEFEEGYADAQVVAPGDEMDVSSRQETFFEIFKNDYDLSDEDINKLKDAVMGIWEASAGN